jgi:Tol biopolymer transport system component
MPAVSKTGIVFESMSAGRYVLNRDLAFEGQSFHPSVPAAGSPIVFELVAGGHSRIMSFDRENKTLEALTVESLDATDPVITLAGDRIAFISRGRIVVFREGPIPTPRPVRDAAWFPDGTHMVFSANGIIYDSKDMQPLAIGIAGKQSEPAISPDGAWLALTATRWGNSQVWVYDLGTGAAREVTGGSCNSYASAWEPDSQALVFASDCGRGLGLPRLYRAPL